MPVPIFRVLTSKTPRVNGATFELIMAAVNPLTPRQKLFVMEYVVDLNGKQAAIRAGYSSRTAEVQASRLLSHVKVQAAVQRAQVSLVERVELSQEWVIDRLREIESVPWLLNPWWGRQGQGNRRL